MLQRTTVLVTNQLILKCQLVAMFILTIGWFLVLIWCFKTRHLDAKLLFCLKRYFRMRLSNFSVWCLASSVQLFVYWARFGSFCQWNIPATRHVLQSAGSLPIFKNENCQNLPIIFLFCIMVLLAHALFIFLFVLSVLAFRATKIFLIAIILQFCTKF